MTISWLHQLTWFNKNTSKNIQNQQTNIWKTCIEKKKERKNSTPCSTPPLSLIQTSGPRPPWARNAQRGGSATAGPVATKKSGRTGAAPFGKSKEKGERKTWLKRVWVGLWVVWSCMVMFFCYNYLEKAFITRLSSETFGNKKTQSFTISPSIPYRAGAPRAGPQGGQRAPATYPPPVLGIPPWSSPWLLAVAKTTRAWGVWHAFGTSGKWFWGMFESIETGMKRGFWMFFSTVHISSSGIHLAWHLNNEGLSPRKEMFLGMLSM